MTREQAIEVLINRYNSGVIRGRINDDEWRLATETAIAALREPSYNWNVKECADLIAAMSEGETLSIRKKNGFLNAVRGETIDEWKPLTVWKNY